MTSTVLLTFAQVIPAPSILLLALNTPTLFYRSSWTRIITLLLIAGAAGRVIATVRISTPSLAFMTGLLECWTVIWAAVLLLRYQPIENASRRSWSRESQRDGEYEERGLIWQRYPQSSRLARLAWTGDLLLGSRGIGWRFGEGKTHMRTVKPSSQPAQCNSRVALIPPILRLLRDVMVLEAVLMITAKLEKSLVESSWQLQVLHTVIWITTSVPFINICHTVGLGHDRCSRAMGKASRWFRTSAVQSESLGSDQSHNGAWTRW